MTAASGVLTFITREALMSQKLAPAARMVAFLLVSANFAQSPPSLSLEDEIRAGNALVASFLRLNGVGDTAEQKRIEKYLQKIGDKVAKNSTRKLSYTFHLDPHPGFRSAVAYPGGQIIVGGGVLALMQHEDELAVVLGHEIAHIDLKQCANRVIEVMQRDHLSARQFDRLSIEDFGKPYGKDGELAADREGLKMAVAAGYSPQAAQELLEVFQLLNRDGKPAPPRTDAPSLEERIQQSRDVVKSQAWDSSKVEQPLELP
jgi:predicted Zn-dependent protease